MNGNFFLFPDQTVPETEKSKVWHMNHALDYVVSDSNSFNRDDNDEMARMLRAYKCIQNKAEKEKCKATTSPHGVSNGVPYIVYNLIEQKIEQLIGDYMSRPIPRKTYVMNKKAQNRKLNAKIDMLSEQFLRKASEDLKQETGLDISTPNPDMEVHEDVESFFSEGNYKDNAEEVADDLIIKFLDVDRQAESLKNLLVDFFLYDKTCATVAIEDGRVLLKKDDPFFTDYDLDPEKNVQNDPEWYIKGAWMTENDIYNRFSLKHKEKKKVKAEFAGLLRHHGSTAKSKITTSFNDDNWYAKENHSFRIFVVDMSWKSPEKIRSKKWTNKDGEEVQTYIGGNSRVKDDEEEIVEYREKPRHVVLAGPNICLSYGEEEHRMYSIQNPNKCRLNRIALHRDNTSGVSVNRSIAAKLVDMQDWASDIMYEIRFAMRKNKGKAFVYDTSQTPKAYLKGNGNPLQRVLHHIGKDQIIFINSKESKNRNSFNQFTTVDLSNQHQIQSLIEGLVLVEEIADKIIGFTPGRKGSSGQHATNENINSQRQASFSRTEIYYSAFDNFLKSTFELVLACSKHAYKKGEVIQYPLGDLRTKFLQLKNDFFDSDIGMFFADPSKDLRKKEIIDSVASQSLGNAQTPDMIEAYIDILFEDSAVEARNKLRATVKAMEESAEKRQEAQSQAEQAAIQSKKESEQATNDIAIRSQDKDIVVADIYADNKEKTEAMKINSSERIKLAENNIKQNK